jgi:hypothetical protein
MLGAFPVGFQDWEELYDDHFERPPQQSLRNNWRWLQQAKLSREWKPEMNL